MPALTQRLHDLHDLHDHSITEALDEVLAVSLHPVAVMGGHDLPRDSPGYANAVALGQAFGAVPKVRTGVGAGLVSGCGPTGANK